jgi:hypothetical protein
MSYDMRNDAAGAAMKDGRSAAFRGIIVHGRAAASSFIAVMGVHVSAARPPEGARPLLPGGGARSRVAASLGEVTQ